MILVHYLTKLVPFEVIVVIALLTIVCLFVYNLCTQAKGSFDENHWQFIKQLLGSKQMSYQPKLRSQASRSTGGTSRGENECRRVIEKLLGRSFPKCRPDFLRNNVTYSNLELDCFNAELGIAVEYNGEQHYKYTPYFHSTKDAFYNIKYRDDMKRRLCEQNGIRLIVVPYTVPVDDIEQYITAQLRRR